MVDVHVHFLHSATGNYNFQRLDDIVAAALKANVDEIYLLEHTHHFCEFKEVYKPIANYNDYQSNWLSIKMAGTIYKYLSFISLAKTREYPIKIKFGLEVCYIPETEILLHKVLDKFDFDFLTGSVHYIDNWGFDHKAEFWRGKNVDDTYRRYYQIMMDLIETGIFSGLAHPDSIKYFQFYSSVDMNDIFGEIAALLNRRSMYVEQSGGLALNYGYPGLGMNESMLKIFKTCGVKIMTASDAHKPEHVGKNIYELQKIIEDA